MNTGSKQMAQL